MFSILVTGTPKSGKTIAAQYFADKLNLYYCTSIVYFMYTAFGKNKILDLDYRDSRYIPELKFLNNSLIHIHMYNEEVEQALSSIMPECTAEFPANRVANYTINNNSSNDKLIFQLDDIINIISAKQDYSL